MTNIVRPKTTVILTNANVTVGNTAQKVLFVGQKTASGSAVAGSLEQNIANGGVEDGLFGESSMLAAMLRAAKKENQVTRFDAIALDDAGAAVAATGTIVIAGTATEVGTLQIILGSEYNHTLSIAVANGDTATVVGDSIAAAVNALTKAPVTAANVAGTVTFTAVNKGTLGNDIALGISGAIAGITHSVTVMTGGATDPTLTGILDVIGTERYQTIVWPYADALTEVKSVLDARFNVTNKVLDGVAVTCKQDTYANHITALDALNSQSIVYIVDKLENETSYKGPAQTELSPVKSSMFAAIRALRYTEGASLSQYVISTNGALDAYGGPELASKPYFNTPLPYLSVNKVGRGWTETEIDALTADGGTVLGTNSAGNTSIMADVVTTYKTDSAANPDITWKYLNYVDTASQCREYLVNNLRARFGQSRLTEGDGVNGRDIVNALRIESYAIRLYAALADMVLVADGEDALLFFKDNLTVTTDLSTGKGIFTCKLPLVTQLRDLSGTVQIAFSINN